jgi:DNA-binding transcriptional MerR regulator
MPKKFLSVKEVSKLLSVTPLTVRNWDKKGLLVAHRNPVNNYRLYKIKDIEELLLKINDSKNKLRDIPMQPEVVKKIKISVIE